MQNNCFSFQKWWMFTKVLLFVFSRVLRVTGPLRAMSWNVAVRLRLHFQLRVPESPGQSILATWLNSSLFLSDNALNCFCWFTVLKAHQSYGSWLGINHHCRAPPGYVHDADVLLLCVLWRRSVLPLLHWHLQDSSSTLRFLNCQGHDMTNLICDDCLKLPCRTSHFKTSTCFWGAYVWSRSSTSFTDLLDC